MKLALLLGCGVVFTTLFLVNFIDYMSHVQKVNFIEWDMRAITSSDYTVEVDLQDDFYPNYKKQEHKRWLSKCATFCSCCQLCDNYHEPGVCPVGTPCGGCSGVQFNSSVQAFQAWFKYEIETRLKRLPDLNYN